jgi:murein endopeptidase
VVKVSIDGKDMPRGRDCRVGHVSNLEGTDLIVWLKLEAMQPTTILLLPETK